MKETNKNIQSNHPMNVVAYCRVSTDAQAGEDRFGIEAQKGQIINYCEQNGLNIIGWYIDEGESGVKESRPKLDELLFGNATNPPIEAVVVYKSDRIARSIKLYYYYMMLLEKKGMQLISATEPIVNDESGLGEVYKTLMLFVAQQERDNITKRTSSGRRIKASKGGYSGGRTPYGYKPVRGEMVIDERYAPIVREIFQMRADGETLHGITDYINENGALTRSGKKFACSTVQKILSNRPIYEGMYRYGDSDWTEGRHKPLL